jgi:hypothetical protein
MLRRETSSAIDVTIGGKPHVILFNLNSLIALKRRGYNILEGGEAFVRLFSTMDPEVMLLLLWAGLRHEDPKRTEDEVGEMITTDDLFALHRSVVDAFRVQSEPEDGTEANPPVEAPPSPGAASGPSAVTT